MIGSRVKLLTAAVILIGGVLLLLPQNGVMAWVESGSPITAMTDANRAASDKIIFATDSMSSLAEQFVIVIEQTVGHAHTVLDAANEIVSNFDLVFAE